MAKIVGPVPPFIGTRDNVTIYLMNGEYIARSKSSLTGKRVKKDPAFAGTMEWAGRLKQGARIASFIYRQIPVDGRVYKQYREITGKAMSLLKEGLSVGDIITMLEAVYLHQQEKNIKSIVTSITTSIKPKAEQDVTMYSIQVTMYGIQYGHPTINGETVRRERAGGNHWPKLFEVMLTRPTRGLIELPKPNRISEVQY